MNYIKQIKLLKDDFLVFYSNSSLKLKYKNEKSRYVVDITSMNLINATKLAILCSTYCFLNGFEKNICWVVKDEQIKNAISILRLQNVDPCLIEKQENERLLEAC